MPIPPIAGNPLSRPGNISAAFSAVAGQRANLESTLFRAIGGDRRAARVDTTTGMINNTLELALLNNSHSSSIAICKMMLDQLKRSNDILKN